MFRVLLGLSEIFDDCHLSRFYTRLNMFISSGVPYILSNLSHTQIRRSVWHSWTQRGSLQTCGQHSSNDSRIQEIRHLRRSVAHFLGCQDWLDLVWRNTSPHSASLLASPDSLVAEVLEPLRVQLKPLAQVEYKHLTEWACANLDVRGNAVFWH